MFNRGFLFAVLLAAVGCGAPQAGDSCSGQVGACADSNNALFCEGGSYRAIPCRGPSGCSTRGAAVQCDVVAKAGDNCPVQDVGQKTCEGDKALKCSGTIEVGGTWQEISCPSCATNSTCQ